MRLKFEARGGDRVMQSRPNVEHFSCSFRQSIEKHELIVNFDRCQLRYTG
jgi:hypothetical protein